MRRVFAVLFLFLAMDPHFGQAAKRMELVQAHLEAPPSALLLPQSGSQNQSGGGGGGVGYYTIGLLLLGILELGLAFAATNFRSQRVWAAENARIVDLRDEINAKSNSGMNWLALIVMAAMAITHPVLGYVMDTNPNSQTFFFCAFMAFLLGIGVVTILGVAALNKFHINRWMRRQRAEALDRKQEFPRGIEAPDHLAKQRRGSRLGPENDSEVSDSEKGGTAGREPRRSSSVVEIDMNSSHETPMGPDIDTTCQISTAERQFGSKFFEREDLFTEILSDNVLNSDVSESARRHTVAHSEQVVVSGQDVERDPKQAAITQARVYLALACVGKGALEDRHHVGEVKVKLAESASSIYSTEFSCGTNLVADIAKLSSESLFRYVPKDLLRSKAEFFAALCSKESESLEGSGKPCCEDTIGEKSTMFCEVTCLDLTQKIE